MSFPIRRACLAIVVVAVLGTSPTAAQPPAAQEPQQQAAAPPAELDQDALRPLDAALERIQEAESLQVRIVETGVVKMDGEVVDEREFAFSAAAERPNRYALSFTASGAGMPEGPVDAVVTDGDELYQTITPEAYLKLDPPEDFAGLSQEVTVSLSNLGPVLVALTMPTVDARQLLLEGVTSAERVDNEPLDDTPAAHVRLTDANATWDFWVTTGDEPELRRLRVDLTDQVRQQNPQLAQADGFSYVVRWELSDWRIGQEIDDEEFEFTPIDGATAYASVEEYSEAMSGGPHPLVGEEAPTFSASTVDGKVIDLARHKGKDVVLIDFWATWCAPCIAALPIISEVAAELEDEGVVFYAVNLGEETDEIEAFLEEKELELIVPMDPEGEVASKYRVTGIPQTVLIGRDGLVQVVHVGFTSEEQLRADLSGQLAALAEGTSLLEVEEEADEAGESAEPPQPAGSDAP